MANRIHVSQYLKIYRHAEGHAFARYWSVYDQAWKTADYRDQIPNREYAAMSAEDRQILLENLEARPE